MGSDNSAVDMFLKILDSSGEPVPGECTDNDYPGAIEIRSFSFDGNTSYSKSKKRKGGSRKSGKDDDDEEDDNSRETNSFQISKHVDASSPQLLLSYCRTKSEKTEEEDIFESAKIVVRKSGGSQVKFLVMYFEDIFVTGYDLDVSSELPEEKVTFAFTKVEMGYSPQSAAGARASKQVVGWDFAALAPATGDAGDDGSASTGGTSPAKGGDWQKHDSKDSYSKPSKPS